jgi:hypothetical protein
MRCNNRQDARLLTVIRRRSLIGPPSLARELNGRDVSHRSVAFGRPRASINRESPAMQSQHSRTDQNAIIS